MSEETTTAFVSSVEVSYEEADRIERLIQIGDPDEKLPTGETVGEYRKRVRAAASKPQDAAQVEAASIRSQAAPSAGMVRMSFGDTGTTMQPLAETEETAKKSRKAGSKKKAVVRKRKVEVEEPPAVEPAT